MVIDGDSRVQHKVRKTGGKVKKRESGDKKERHNPKAFTFSGGVNSVHRRVQYSLDQQTKKERSNLIVDKTPDSNPPPFIIVVQGPSGVGKTLLIQSLVKSYTKQNVSSIRGPITLVSGKSRRITFVECPNDFSSMVDLSKIADLVLLMIDGSFGFEMETFEFLNMLQTHGFPRVMGVLTHLDKFEDNKSLRRRKKVLKNRFWAEIYDGAKLFYLSGLQYGRYNKTEILNLTRFISVQKSAPLVFRSQRPYLLSLRCEDHTSENIQEDEMKTVHIYGYVKGATLRACTNVHIPGAGDFSIKSVEEYRDPCPLPNNNVENKNDGGRVLRTLKSEQRRCYGPDCNIGNVRYEQDGMYIHLPDHKVGFTKPEHVEKDGVDPSSSSDESEVEDNEIEPEAVNLVRSLQDAHGQLDKTLSEQTLKLLPTSTVNAADLSDVNRSRRAVPVGAFRAVGRADQMEMDEEIDEEEVDGDVSDTDDHDKDGDDINSDHGNGDDSDHGNGDDSDDDDDDDDGIGNEFDLSVERGIAHAEINEKFKKEPSLSDLIYNICSLKIEDQPSWIKGFGESSQHDEGGTRHLFEDDDDNNNNGDSCTSEQRLVGDLDPRTDKQMLNSEEANLLSEVSMYSGMGRPMNSLNEIENFWSPSTKKQFRAQHFITGGWDGEDHRKTEEDDENGTSKAIKSKRDDRTVDEIIAEMEFEKKARKEEMDKNRLLLTEAQSLVKEGGAIIGAYVRIVVENVPSKWFNFVKEKMTPIIVGGLLSGESDVGMVQTRIKRHRWAPKILKSNDPLLISAGWRRFQTLPIYCLEDRGNVRVRMLKYTPEHLHCLATFYGPISAPSSGILAIRSWAHNVRNFRISATGLVLDTAPNFKIVKKLKLVGEPQKILKNTAFVRKMFTSDLEVSKCIGAKIQTVSGIRGQIKKAQGKDGVFRATFEDKILMSDLIVCKAWIKVEPKEFWNPLLDITDWRRVRTLAEIRNDLQRPAPNSNATDYGAKQERQIRRFNPLRIPKSIERDLPFKSRPKTDRPKKKTGGLLAEATAVTLNAYEKTVATMFNRLHLLAKDKKRERSLASAKRQNVKAAEESRINAIRQVKQKEVRKKRCAIAGAKEARDRKRLKIQD